MRMTRNTQRGFTLIETVVSISILMLGVLGPMMLARQNLKASRDASDRLIASFLAQEGIESVRNVISNNSADTSDASQWLLGIVPPPGPVNCSNATMCILDITQVDVSQSGDNILQNCNGACSPTIYQNSTNYLYRQTSGGAPGNPWVATKFNRYISVQVVEAGKRVTASTTVWWPRGNVTLQEDIYNWYFQLN
jgi:prepilin-type N-terminal cleavage/methylation domain-containing protein